MTTTEHDHRLTEAILTQGILDGLVMRTLEGPLVSPNGTVGGDGAGSTLLIGPDSHSIVVGDGFGLDHCGRLLKVDADTTVDLAHLLRQVDGVVGHLYLVPEYGPLRPDSTPIRPEQTAAEALFDSAADQLQHSRQVAPLPASGPEPHTASVPAAVQLYRNGDPLPRHAVPIASIRRDGDAAILQLSPINAWLTSSGMLIGSRNSAGLAITDDAIVAAGTLHLVGGGRDAKRRNHHVVIGPRRGRTLELGGGRLAARTNGTAADLHIQADGGDAHFGGAVRGPEREPLTVLGGSDVSLSGGGVLMLGDEEGPNLVLDENEIMAREDGSNAPLLLQWEGGETRFGGAIRGPVDGPLNVVGGKDLSLGGHGALMIGPPEAAHLILDDNEIMAKAGGHSSNLYLQWQGGETHFGGPLEITSADPERRLDSWRMEAGDNGTLSIAHDGVIHTWFDPTSGAVFSGSEFSKSEFLAAPENAEADEELDGAIALLQDLKPLRSVPADLASSVAVGFDPAEVAPVAPELVGDHGGTTGICHSRLLTYVVAAVKEQQHTIEALQRRIVELESETSDHPSPV